MVLYVEARKKGLNMKILIAGSSGAIGQPLLSLLCQSGNEVYGITHSQEKAVLISEKGAKPVILNILDRDAVASAIKEIRPEIVIDMLTHLPKEYTPSAMREAAPMDAKVRREGGGYLQSAAEANGAKRYILQSSGFWYEPGEGLADESTAFAFKATPGIAAGSNTYAELEKRVLQSDKIEGIALRFGFFYGLGTWFYPHANVAQQVERKQFPLIGTGHGIWNFLHIEDAAQAIVATIRCKPGIYNIVNDEPIQVRDWLPAFAEYIGAEPPPKISEQEGLKQFGADWVYYATKLRAASNAKAKKEFHFKPRPLEWFKK